MAFETEHEAKDGSTVVIRRSDMPQNPQKRNVEQEYTALIGEDIVGALKVTWDFSVTPSVGRIGDLETASGQKDNNIDLLLFGEALMFAEGLVDRLLWTTAEPELKEFCLEVGGTPDKNPEVEEPVTFSWIPHGEEVVIH